MKKAVIEHISIKYRIPRDLHRLKSIWTQVLSITVDVAPMFFASDAKALDIELFDAYRPLIVPTSKASPS